MWRRAFIRSPLWTFAWVRGYESVLAARAAAEAALCDEGETLRWKRRADDRWSDARRGDVVAECFDAGFVAELWLCGFATREAQRQARDRISRETPERKAIIAERTEVIERAEARRRRNSDSESDGAATVASSG